MSTSSSFLLIVVPAAAAWLTYFGSKGWNRHGLMAFAALGGFFGVPVALAAFALLERLGVPVSWEPIVEGPWRDAVGMAAVAASVEELAKVLPVAAVFARYRALANSRSTAMTGLRPIDGLILASFAGVGFAMAEVATLWSSGEITPSNCIARALATPVTHAVFAAPAGFGIAIWALRSRVLPLIAGLVASIGGHALYDLTLAREVLPNVIAPAIVLGLWIWLIVRTRAPKVAAEYVD